MPHIMNILDVVKIVHDLPEEGKDVSKHIGVAKDRSFWFDCKL